MKKSKRGGRGKGRGGDGGKGALEGEGFFPLSPVATSFFGGGVWAERKGDLDIKKATLFARSCSLSPFCHLGARMVLFDFVVAVNVIPCVLVCVSSLSSSGNVLCGMTQCGSVEHCEDEVRPYERTHL